MKYVFEELVERPELCSEHQVWMIFEWRGVLWCVKYLLIAIYDVVCER